MRAALFAVVVPVLFCGFLFGVAPVPKAPGPEPEPDSDLDPAFAARIKLPDVTGAKALDKALKDKIYLCVNEQGKALLVPSDGFTDKGIGVTISTLDNPAQVLVYLKRRAKEDRMGAGDTNIEKPPSSTIILRVHKDCPFDKTYAILKAVRMAEYTKFQWRVSSGSGGEGQIPFTPAKPGDEKPVHFVARVTSDDKGQIEKITLSGDGIEKELDLKADVDAFTKKLKELEAKNKGKRLKLTLELADKLLQAHVVKLIDESIRAGFEDVSPVPIDKSKR
jgi:hypothetical protein